MDCPFYCTDFVNCVFNITIINNIYPCGYKEPPQAPECNCGCGLPFPCDGYIFPKAISAPKKKRKSSKKSDECVSSVSSVTEEKESRKRKAPEDCPNMNGYCIVSGKYNTKIEKICTHPQCRTA